MIETKLLQNGLTLAYEKVDAGLDCVRLTFAAGAFTELNFKKGVSHFIEHMVFNGSEKYTYDYINTFASSLGGGMNASTSNTITSYYMYGIKGELRELLKLMVDMCFHPQFLNIEKERAIIVEEFNDSQSDDFNQMWNSYFASHEDPRLKCKAIGELEDIESMTEADLFDYHNKFYIPSNCVMYVASDKSFEEVQEQVLSVLMLSGLLLQSPQEVYENVYDIQATTRETHNISKEAMDDTSSKVLLYWDFDKEDRHIVTMLSGLLGGELWSKFTKVLREERGLAYMCGTTINKSLDKYELCFVMSTSDGDIVDDIEEEIQDILVKCIDPDDRLHITEKEVSTCRNIAVGSECKGQLDYINNSYSVSTRIISGIGVLTTKDVIDQFSGITLDVINRFIVENMIGITPTKIVMDARIGEDKE